MRSNNIFQKLYHYCKKLINYCDGYTYDTFQKDSKLVEACVFNLSQMGELCHNADEDLVRKHPELPWAELYGLRNRIVHDYDGVNLRLVWEILSEDIPALQEKVKDLVSRPESQ